MENTTETKRTRITPDRKITVDDVKAVYEQYHEKTATQLAAERGLAKSQITTIITNLHSAGLTAKKRSDKSVISEFITSVSLAKASGKKGKK